MNELTAIQKQMIAFALFSQAMRAGPLLFAETDAIVAALGITEEFAKYANSWIDYSKENNQNTCNDNK